MSTRVLDARTVAALAAMLLLAATSFAVGRSTAPPLDTGPGFDISSPEAMARSFQANLVAAAAGYIKIDGIDGEATAHDYEGWSELRSFTYPISRVSGSNTGTTRQRGDTVQHDVEVAKELDKASPKLAESVVDGTVATTVRIELVRDVGGESPVPFLTYELKDVRITSYRLSSRIEGVPTDELRLAFSEVVMTYTSYGADGRATGKVESSWKVEEGTV